MNSNDIEKKSPKSSEFEETGKPEGAASTQVTGKSVELDISDVSGKSGASDKPGTLDKSGASGEPQESGNLGNLGKTVASGGLFEKSTVMPANTNQKTTDNTTPKHEKILTGTFLAISATNLCSFACWQMCTTGLPVYVSQLGGTSFQIGLVTSIASLATTLTRPFLGALIDRYGRKGFWICGYVMMLITTVCYAIFPLIGAILALRLIHGLGWGFGSSACSTLAADTLPRKHFAEGMGYFGMTNSLASSIGPALALFLLEWGHPNLMIFTSAGATALAVILSFYVCSKSHQEVQLKKEGTLFDAFRLSNMFERTSLFPCIVTFLVSIGYGAVNTFIAIMGNERGIENMSIYFFIFAIFCLVFRPSMGKMVDKRGYYGAGLIATFVTALAMFMAAYINSIWMVCITGVVSALGMGSAMSTFQSMAASRAPSSSRGSALAVYMLAFNGGISVGGCLSGVLVDPLGYTGMFVVMGATAILSGLVFIAGGRKRIESYRIS